MTDPTPPFAPPSTPLPAPTAATPFAGPPPDGGGPSNGPASSPPPRSRLWLVPVVIVSSVAFLGLAVAAAFGGTQVARLVAQETPAPSAPAGEAPADPIPGDPGGPFAAEPLECDGCFDYGDATVLRLGLQPYRTLGLTLADGVTGLSYVGDEREVTAQWWEDDRGSPAECGFTYAIAPLLPGVDARADDDRLHYPSWHSDADEYYWLTEVVRVFDDSGAATSHLVDLESAIAGCESYASPSVGRSSFVVAAAALDLPPSVAAYGWVETSGYGRFYAVDLQRGNLVLRLTLTSDGDGPSEAAFRAFAEAYAVLLSELEPSR